VAPSLALPPRRALREIGLAMGVFIAVNLLGEVIRPPFETLSDWVSPLGPWSFRGLLAGATAAALIVNGTRRDRPVALRAAASCVLALVAAFALVDTGRFYTALTQGWIHTPAVVPASVIVAVVLVALVWDMRASAGPEPVAAGAVPRAVVFALVFAAIPLVRMFTFGPTRYDRRAACAIVLGARVWNDGTPSDALADRVDEAVHLYKNGLTQKLVMSGGVEPENGLSEAEVMRRRATAEGVRDEDVLLDEAGVDTASTVRNSAALMRREGFASALVVTHYYHEPRVKMLFDRAGVTAYTVPAHMRRRLLKEPYFVVREVAAYWRAFMVG
jgi:uncharacterized SAM-binding protein YcdF (DUF218 family)